MTYMHYSIYAVTRKNGGFWFAKNSTYLQFLIFIYFLLQYICTIKKNNLA